MQIVIGAAMVILVGLPIAWLLHRRQRGGPEHGRRAGPRIEPRGSPLDDLLDRPVRARTSTAARWEPAPPPGRPTGRPVRTAVRPQVPRSKPPARPTEGRGAPSGTSRGRPSPVRAPRGPHPVLEADLLLLARRFWGPAETLSQGEFRLNPSLLPRSNLEAAASQLLRHARRAAPGVGFLSLTPQVVLREGGPQTAGTFCRDGEGFFHVEVDPVLARTPEVAHAILAHELGHYVLAANGLRRPEMAENERLTEVAVFALGFGDIYIRCGEALRASSRRHHLGYLTQAQYRFLHSRADELRATNGAGLATELDRLRQELRAMVFREESRQSLIEEARALLPGANEKTLYRHVIERLRRDLH